MEIAEPYHTDNRPRKVQRQVRQELKILTHFRFDELENKYNKLVNEVLSWGGVVRERHEQCIKGNDGVAEFVIFVYYEIPRGVIIE